MKTHFNLILTTVASLLAAGASAQPTERILWQSPYSGDFGPTLGKDGAVYLVKAWSLVALKPDGSKNWEIQTTSIGQGAASASVGEDGNIYVGTYNAGLLSISPQGAVNWSFPGASSGAPYTPAIGADGTIYFSSGANLYAVNTNGAQRWSYTAVSPITTSPTIGSDGTIYFGTAASAEVAAKTVAVEPLGQKLWETPLDTSSLTALAIDRDGNIYGRACLTPQGVPQWGIPQEYQEPLTSLSVGWGGEILAYFNSSLSSYSRAAAYSPLGYQLWETVTSAAGYPTTAPNQASGFVADADGTIYVTVGSSLQAFWPQNGATRWTLNVGGSLHGNPDPIMSDSGVIYVTGGNGGNPGADGTYAIQASCGPANSGWPMKNHDARRTNRATLPKRGQPCLCNLQFVRDQGYVFRVSGDKGVQQTVEATTNFVNWTPMTSYTQNVPQQVFLYPQATNTSATFFRAKRP